MRVAENPNDFYGAFYLGREYSFYNRFEDSNKTFLSILDGEYNEMKDDLVIAGCYTFVADNYRKMGDDLSAIEYYMKSIQQDKTYREPYLYIAGYSILKLKLSLKQSPSFTRCFKASLGTSPLP